MRVRGRVSILSVRFRVSGNSTLGIADPNRNNMVK